MIVDPARRARSPASTVSRWMDSTLVGVPAPGGTSSGPRVRGGGGTPQSPRSLPPGCGDTIPHPIRGLPLSGAASGQYNTAYVPSRAARAVPSPWPSARRPTRYGFTSGPRRGGRDVIMGQRCMEHAYLAQRTRSWGLVLVLVTLTGRHDSPPRHPSIRVGGPVIGSPMVSRSSTTVVSPGLTVTVASGSLASL